MKKEPSVLERLYKEPEYQEIAKFVGYQGTVVRDLYARIELLAAKYDKRKLETAAVHLTVYEGQFTSTPKSLAEVKLRSDVRKCCHQLLGPAPEDPGYEEYWRINQREPPDAKRAEPQPKPKTPRGKKPAAPKPAAIRN